MKPIVKKLFGIYGKFRIERTDGRSAPGEKHDGCAYFVLDLTHDPLAIPALSAYAAAAQEAGYDILAADLRVAALCLERGEHPWSADLQPWAEVERDAQSMEKMLGERTKGEQDE